MSAVGGRRRGAIEGNDGPQNKRRRGFQQSPPSIPAIVGQVLVCGEGDVGQLGLGDDASKYERKRPTLVGISGVVAICAGGMHTVLLDINGVVHTFGCNDEGALGRDSSEEGSEFTPGSVDLPGKVAMISAGDSHTAALLDDGRIFAWGSFRDSHGNMGLTLDGNKRLPVQMFVGARVCNIASGSDHLVILTCHGKVFTLGCAEQGQLGRITLRSASGEGRLGKRDLLHPTQVMIRRGKMIDAIWASNYCTFVRETSSGIIWGFGLNNYKQLACDKEGELANNPVITKFENVKQIAGGQHHTLVLKNDGSCHVIGRHDYGRLGLGAIKTDVTEVTEIPALRGKKVTSIACGEAQSFAVTDDGKLYAWGMGSNFQLGTGSEDDELEPVLIDSKQTQDKHLLCAAGGGQHSVFLATDKEQELADTSKPRGARAVPVKAAATTTTIENGDGDEPVTSTSKTAKERSPPF